MPDDFRDLFGVNLKMSKFFNFMYPMMFDRNLEKTGTLE